MTAAQLDLFATGGQLRDAGIAAVDANTDLAWRNRADAAIALLAADCRRGALERFTAEDVRALAGDPPHPNAMGGRFIYALRSGLIAEAGWSRSTRPAAHACRLRLYRHQEDPAR